MKRKILIIILILYAILLYTTPVFSQSDSSSFKLSNEFKINKMDLAEQVQ